MTSITNKKPNHNLFLVELEILKTMNW